MQLRPYQAEACTAIVREFEKGTRSTLLILPTGCGKTVVFNGVAFRYAYNPDRTESGGRVLILAHQNILIEQAADKFTSVLGIPVSKEKGRAHCFDSYPVTVSSMQTMQKRLHLFQPDYFDLIIIDEAHHTESGGYKKMLNHFKTAKVLGVTATPDRADGKKLTAFESIAYQYTIEQAQKEGYLARLNVVKSDITIDIRKVRRKRGDFEAGELGEVIEPHLNRIAIEVRQKAKGRRIVCFVPLIKTAKKASDIFSHYGFRTDWVSGNDPDKAQKLERFAGGDIDIIFNAMLLTEGWDCPETDCVIVLRPTESRALYTQMVGRGLRLADGKTDCLIIDYLFRSDRFDLASPSDVLGENKPKNGSGLRPGAGGTAQDAEVRLAKALEDALTKSPYIDPHNSERWGRLLQELKQHPSGLYDPAPNDSQKRKLKEMKINPKAVTYREARAIIDFENEQKSPTNAQKWRLQSLGYTAEEVGAMSFKKAQEALRTAKARERW